VLIAVVAIAASAAPAKADIYLAVSNQSAGGSTTYFNLSHAPGAGAFTGTGSYTLSGTEIANLGLSGGNITVSYNNTTTNAGLAGSLSLGASVTSASGAAQTSLQFSLFSNSQSLVGFNLGTFSNPVASPPLSLTSGIGAYDTASVNPAFVNGKGVLSSSLTNVSFSGGFFSLSASSTYLAHAAAPGGAYLGQQTDSGIGVSALNTANKSSAGVVINNVAPRFDLESVEAIVSLDAGTTVNFTATAQIAMPEPSGVIAAMAGLPCVGMLLGYARRLRSRPTPEAAA
jgi:hypothetical protein